MHRTWSGVPRSAGKHHEGSRKLGEPQKMSGNLKKGLVRLYEGYGM